MKNIFKYFIDANIRLSNKFESYHKQLYIKFNCKNLISESIRKEISKKNKMLSDISVLEVGGIDRPVFNKSTFHQYDGLDVDISKECDSVYDNFNHQSIENKITQKYDVIFSKMVLEHVPNNKSAWENMFQALESEGLCIHLFPAAYHPFSVINRIVGHPVQKWLIPRIRPNAKNTGYKAYYNHCSTYSLQKLLKSIGFKEVNIKVYYSAEDYFKFFFPFFIIITFFNIMCRKLNLNIFASNLFIVAKK